MRTYEQTLETATRRGFVWTGPELELIARDDLSAKEVAVMLGRTYFAVKNMQRKIRDEPKYIKLAGVSTKTMEGKT